MNTLEELVEKWRKIKRNSCYEDAQIAHAIGVCADQLEAELRSPGPCGKHPRMFWISGQEEISTTPICTAEATNPNRKMIFVGHCTLCAELASAAEGYLDVPSRCAWVEDARREMREQTKKEAVHQVWDNWDVPITKLESSWMAAAIAARIQNL